jgi:hypothetical protein
MNVRSRYNLVAAIYLNTRGFAFVLFEGMLAPVDWGIVELRGKDRRARTIERVSTLLARYVPDLLVLQDMSRSGSHRSHRIRHLNDDIAEIAERLCIPTVSYSRADVRDCFGYLGVVTKDHIAGDIAKRIPAFERFLPRPRKIWMNEDARMGLFDAAALALTFFHGLAEGGQWAT